jgi:hypothetical protein
MGVRVSWRAKKAGWRILTRTKAGGAGVRLQELAAGEEAVHQVDRHGDQGGGGGQAEGEAEDQGLVHDRLALGAVLLGEGP